MTGAKRSIAMTLFEFNTAKPRLKESGKSLSELRRFERQRLDAARGRYYDDPTPENEAALAESLNRFASIVLYPEREILARAPAMDNPSLSE
jgi:hypothetical protein